MASSHQKALWASSGFRSRTAEDRKAYRAKIKADLAARHATPEWKAAQERITAAHAAWLRSQKLED